MLKIARREEQREEEGGVVGEHESLNYHRDQIGSMNRQEFKH